MTDSNLHHQYYYLRQSHKDYPEKAFRLTADEKKGIYFWDSYLIDPFVIFGGKDKIKEKGFITAFATLCKKGFEKAGVEKSFDLRNLYNLGMKHEIMKLEQQGINPRRQHRFTIETDGHADGKKPRKFYTTELFDAPAPLVAPEKFSENDPDGVLNDDPNIGRFSYEFRQTGRFSPELKKQLMLYIELEKILADTQMLNGHQKNLTAFGKGDTFVNFICRGLTDSFDMSVGFQIQKYNVPVITSDTFRSPDKPYAAFAPNPQETWRPLALNYSRVMEKPIAAPNMMQVLECHDAATEENIGEPFFNKADLQQFADFLNERMELRIKKTPGMQLKDKHLRL
jgi:hypothetical protein